MLPSPSPDATWAKLTGLAREGLRTQARLAKQTLELGRATLAGDIDRGTAGRAYLEAVAREGERYWKAVTGLGLDYAADLVALGGKLTTGMLSVAVRAKEPEPLNHWQHDEAASSHVTPEGGGPRPFTSSSRAPQDDRTPRPFTSSSRAPQDDRTPRPFTSSSRTTGEEGTPRQIPVDLRGSLSETASATVTVENTKNRRRRLDLTPAGMTTRNGRPVEATLRVDPSSVTLAAGEQHDVTVSVDLDPATFTAGRTYRGRVQVTGGDEATIDVRVEVS